MSQDLVKENSGQEGQQRGNSGTTGGLQWSAERTIDHGVPREVRVAKDMDIGLQGLQSCASGCEPAALAKLG